MSADHLAPVEDPKARRRCKCEFSGGGVWAKQCEFHRRLLGVKEALPSETGPIVAHSKTEYKRLKEQGANVLPPSATGATSDIVNRILDNVRKARLVDENFTEHLDLISCGVGLLAASSPPVEVEAIAWQDKALAHLAVVRVLMPPQDVLLVQDFINDSRMKKEQ